MKDLYIEQSISLFIARVYNQEAFQPFINGLIIKGLLYVKN